MQGLFQLGWPVAGRRNNMDVKEFERENERIETSGEGCCDQLMDPCTCYYADEPCEYGHSGCRMVMDPCCC